MRYSKNYYETTFQYELSQKFRYLDTEQLFRLKKTVLSATSKDFSTGKKLAFSLFFQMYTGQRSKLTSSNADSTKLGRRVMKGDPVGYKLTLRGKEFFMFFQKIVDKSGGELKYASTNSLKNNHCNSYSFKVKNILSFSKMENHYKYMRTLSDLHVCLVTEANNSEELNFFSRTFKL